jgi:uncharacterized protein
MERKELTWDEYGHALFVLAKKVLDSDYIPHVIVASLKGGIDAARSIAFLHAPVWYSALDISRNGTERGVEFPYAPLNDGRDISHWNILLVEDDNITGLGLEAACSILQKRGAKTRTAALFVNQKTAPHTDFYFDEVETFPDYPFKLFNSGNREHFARGPYIIRGYDAGDSPPPSQHSPSISLDYFHQIPPLPGTYLDLSFPNRSVKNPDFSGEPNSFSTLFRGMRDPPTPSPRSQQRPNLIQRLRSALPYQKT